MNLSWKWRAMPLDSRVRLGGVELSSQRSVVLGIVCSLFALNCGGSSEQAAMDVANIAALTANNLVRSEICRRNQKSEVDPILRTETGSS
jgi:hypothetical protein